MTLYIFCVLLIAGAIVADHYKHQLVAFFKRKLEELKQIYAYHTRDKLAGLRAMDEDFNDSIEYLSKVKGKYTFDKALDKAVDNIHKGRLKDSIDRIHESINKDMARVHEDVAKIRADARKIREDARRAGIEPAAFNLKKLRELQPKTTVRKRTTIKKKI